MRPQSKSYIYLHQFGAQITKRKEVSAENQKSKLQEKKKNQRPTSRNKNPFRILSWSTIRIGPTTALNAKVGAGNILTAIMLAPILLTDWRRGRFGRSHSRRSRSGGEKIFDFIQIICYTTWVGAIDRSVAPLIILPFVGPIDGTEVRPILHTRRNDILKGSPACGVERVGVCRHGAVHVCLF